MITKKVISEFFEPTIDHFEMQMILPLLKPIEFNDIRRLAKNSDDNNKLKNLLTQIHNHGTLLISKLKHDGLVKMGRD